MIFPTTLSKFFQLSFTSKTWIKFDQNIKFSTLPERTGDGKYKFHIYDVSGKFQIRYVYSKGINQYISYDQRNQSFVVKKCSDKWFEFTIIAEIEFNEIDKPQNPYDLYVPFNRFNSMKPLDFYKEKLRVPINDEMLTLNVYVKKITKDWVQVIVENNIDGLKINDLPGNFEYSTSKKCDISQKLIFTFDSSSFKKQKQIIQKNIPQPSIPNQSNETEFAQNKIVKNCATTIINSKWYEIMSNNQFSDVTLISSDNFEIPSHRCILAKYSQIFATIFESQHELPVKINVENFDAETIQSALGFLYDKIDSIYGKEIDVFKFAINYEITYLIDYCSSYFDQLIRPENVCEYIRIAYFKNFNELKQKCFKIMVEKKNEIDETELKILPKNILVDAFRYEFDQ